MAKLASSNLLITVAKAVKDSDSDYFEAFNEEMIVQLEAVLAELVGEDYIIEVTAVAEE